MKKRAARLRIPVLCSALLLWVLFLGGCAGAEIIYAVDQDGIETASEVVQYDGQGGSRIVSESGVGLQEADGVDEQETLATYDPGMDGR